MRQEDLQTTPDFEQKVLGAFLEGDRLKQIPAQLKKRLVVLRHLAGAFERERVYTEREVNDVLCRYHEDFATLRREMVETGLLVRHRGEYARPD